MGLELAMGSPLPTMTEPEVDTEREAWLEERRGKITASHFPDLMKIPRAKKDVWTASALTYLHQVVAERLGGHVPEQGSAATRWGIENEPHAIDAYRERTGGDVVANGYRFESLNDGVGGTPDFFTQEGGCGEVKCPYNPGKHMTTLMTQVIPDEYYWQCVGHMCITDRGWCDFVSFDPRLDGSARLVVIRLFRDDKQIEALKERLALACKYVDDAYDAIALLNDLKEDPDATIADS